MKLKVVNYSKKEYSFNETWRYHLLLDIHVYPIDKDDLNNISIFRR